MKCCIHSGYLKVNKISKTFKWSCCEEEDPNAPPCSELKHNSADWPEEEAKLYFYNKPVIRGNKDEEF
jgi:hypothetical protein